MKKFASAVLFLAFAASTNAASLESTKTHLQDNWGKYAVGSTTVVALGTALYYECKYNDKENLKAIKNLVKKHPKIAAALLATGTALAGVGTYGFENTKNLATENTSKASSKVKETATNVKAKVTGWFSRENTNESAEEQTEQK